MTEDSALPELQRILVGDTSPLHHAIKAQRIDLLAYLVAGHRNVTTAAVIQELEHYRLPTDGLDWLEVVHVDGLQELIALVEWMNRVVDDQDARSAAKSAGMAVCGSLRIVAAAAKAGRVTRYEAGRLIDDLIDTGARYPCHRGKFVDWAIRNKLLAERVRGSALSPRSDRAQRGSGAREWSGGGWAAVGVWGCRRSRVKADRPPAGAGGRFGRWCVA